MKTLGLRMLALFLLMVGAMVVRGQERDAEVPGDYFSLEGALELFKKSASPEEFEKKLNAENSKVNNLDLNGDGYIDYLRVIDRNDGNVHAFTIQAVISDNELQDVAVIELEKLANGKAVLQITGDEDVYGIETIIEPTEEVRVNAGTTTSQTVVNVWAWPAVQYVYDPYYTVWVSPWGWYSRPIWWRTWTPVAYYSYHSWWQPYRPYYARCYSHRVVYAHTIYRPYRTSSVIVRNRHSSQLTHYRTAHRDDNRRNYQSGRTTGRNDYRVDRSNSSVPRQHGRQIDTNRTRSERMSNHEQPIRSRIPRESSIGRDRQATSPSRNKETSRIGTDREAAKRDVKINRYSTDREIGSIQRRDNTPDRRSGGTINRSQNSQRQSTPVVRPERSNRSSGDHNSRSSQPRERSRRSK